MKKLVDFAICHGNKCSIKKRCIRFSLFSENETKQGFSDRQKFVSVELNNCMEFINKTEYDTI